MYFFGANKTKTPVNALLQQSVSHEQWEMDCHWRGRVLALRISMLTYAEVWCRIPTFALRIRQRIHRIVSRRRVCFLVRLDLFNWRTTQELADYYNVSLSKNKRKPKNYCLFAQLSSWKKMTVVSPMLSKATWFSKVEKTWVSNDICTDTYICRGGQRTVMDHFNVSS